jgi:hypothetical protein
MLVCLDNKHSYVYWFDDHAREIRFAIVFVQTQVGTVWVSWWDTWDVFKHRHDYVEQTNDYAIETANWKDAYTQAWEWVDAYRLEGGTVDLK